MEKEYYYLKNGMKQGPFTLDALKKEPINPDTQVYHSEALDFAPARTFPELQSFFAEDRGTTVDESNYNRREPNYNTSASTPSPQTAFEAAGNGASSSTYDPNMQRPPMPESYLVWGILVTVLCGCGMPLGIVSIINASKVGSAYAAGDYVGAEKASKDAKKWAIWGAVSGSVFVVLYILFVVVVAAAGFMDA